MPTRRPIDKRKLPAAIAAARDTKHPASLSLQGGDARVRLTDALAETILLRVMTGTSIKQCAMEYGCSPGAIYMRCLDDPDGFGARYRTALAFKSHIIKDTVLEVALDPERTAADKAVIIDALKWTAKIDNRAEFGDKLQIDQKNVTVNMPPWSRDV